MPIPINVTACPVHMHVLRSQLSGLSSAVHVMSLSHQNMLSLCKDELMMYSLRVLSYSDYLRQ
jgi:hypothetical protein